ncbi:CPBP family intramembrane glutamic endopeptidase [Ligilactobacillus murinus]|uniref:CPBP family intramembrane glutamic endopeptidase n=1 Tax=Ligilactobacillus murinus TaxID=1622 RepID=UPI00096FD309|nr:type II CAAX endopeptidase family protein [Ligilactobacillus murinus]
MEKTERKDLKKTLWIGLSCLIAFNIAILVALSLLNPENPDESGVPYFFAVAAELFIIFVATNKKTQRQLFDVYRQPTAAKFFQWVCFLGLTQIIFSYNSALIEMLLNFFHLSAQSQEESATGANETLSMFIYGSFLAPFGEEILFRGFLLQNFKRYGVRFAIIFSAILFGIYHGNIVQTPFAFILGLLLGYITVSYGLKYAIAVHIFNNMVLADFLDRFLQLFSENTATTISTIIMGSLALGGLYYLYRFWHTQRQKLFAPIDYSVIRSALFNLPFMILLVICLLEMLAGLTPLH